MHFFSELPVKQGVLFSEDEHKMDVDDEKKSGLLAQAKITLFQVEDRLLAYSIQPIGLYVTVETNVWALLL